MPRIAFIPDPISFADDPSNRLVAPIMQNAMSLMDTLSTEVPRLRMQTERHNADMAWNTKARARQEQEWGIADEERQTKADEALSSGLLGSLSPDAADLNDDGIPDLVMGGTGRSRSSSVPTMPGGKAAAPVGSDYERGIANFAKDTDEYQKLRDDLAKQTITDPTTKEVRGLTKDEIDARLAAAGRTAPVEPVASSADLPEGVAQDPFAPAILDDAEAGDVAPAEVGGAAGAAGAMPGLGRPVLSPARREQALIAFDRIKNLPPERRARMGFSDERLWNIYQLLGGQTAPAPGAGAQEASMTEEAGVPTMPVDDGDGGDGAALAAPMPPAGAEAPAVVERELVQQRTADAPAAIQAAIAQQDNLIREVERRHANGEDASPVHRLLLNLQAVLRKVAASGLDVPIHTPTLVPRSGGVWRAGPAPVPVAAPPAMPLEQATDARAIRESLRAEFPREDRADRAIRAVQLRMPLQ